ncbi:MAG: PEP-CTERM sorting domain-containing protein [Fimbriimonadaceae bacterium]
MHALRNVSVCLAVSAMMGLGAVASAQTTIGDFETSALDGWGSDGGPGSPTYAQSTIGVTHGSFSLNSSTAQGGFWGPSTGNLVSEGYVFSLENSTQLSLDLTLNSVNINGGSGSFNGFAQSNELSISLFSPSSGSNLNLFIQENWGAAGVSDSLGQNADWNGVDGTRHLVWNLNAFTATDPHTSTTKTVAQFLQTYSDISDARINFVEQTGNGSTTVGNAQFFFDNVQLNASPAPEPASIGLLGLGVAALIRRRARRQ